MTSHRLRIGIAQSRDSAPRHAAGRTASRRRSGRRNGLHSISPLELALVMVMLAVAVAVAVPQYLRLQQDARNDSARTRLDRAASTLEARRAQVGTYVGSAPAPSIRLRSAGALSYCIETKAGGRTWHLRGPQGKAAAGACPTSG